MRDKPCFLKLQEIYLYSYEEGNGKHTNESVLQLLFLSQIKRSYYRSLKLKCVSIIS